MLLVTSVRNKLFKGQKKTSDSSCDVSTTKMSNNSRAVDEPSGDQEESNALKEEDGVPPTTIAISTTTTEDYDLILTDSEIEAARPSLVTTKNATTTATSKKETKKKSNSSWSIIGTSKHHDTTPTTTVTAATDQQRRIQVVLQWLAYVNAGDARSSRVCVAPDTIQMQFLNKAKVLDFEMCWEEFAGFVENLLTSFPDFRLDYENIVVHHHHHHHDNNNNKKKAHRSFFKMRSSSTSANTTGAPSPPAAVIVLTGARASGNHTGKPFGFGPFEPIATSGKFVQNDPEELYFFFGKGEMVVSKLVFATKGDMTGPAGFYTQLGGFPVL